MSAPDWIMLFIHPHDEKVLRLSELTGEDPHTVVGRCVAWFRWIDQQLSTDRTAIRGASLLHILGVGAVQPREGSLDYVRAMEDVGWISVNGDGFISVRGYEDSFSKSAKNRALAAKRQAHFRTKSRNSNANSNGRALRKHNGQRYQEEKRNINTLPADAGSLGGDDEIPPPPSPPAPPDLLNAVTATTAPTPASPPPPAPSSSPHRECVMYWCEAWERKYGRKYAFSGKDAKHVQDMLKAFETVRGVQAVMTAFLADDDAFYRGHELSQLRGAMNRFNAIAARKSPVASSATRSPREALQAANERLLAQHLPIRGKREGGPQ